MPKHIDESSWKQSPSDIAFRNPFSSATEKVRWKLLFFSVLCILSSSYPPDLSKSYILGIKFEENAAIPVIGLLGILTAYFFVALIIYMGQELKAWLAQAKIVKFEQYQRQLHDIYAHSQSLGNELKALTENVNLNIDPELLNGDKAWTGNELAKDDGSFGATVTRLQTNIEKYINETEAAEKIFIESKKEFGAALRLQLFKVGLLEVILPVAIAVYALYRASTEIVPSFISVINSGV